MSYSTSMSVESLHQPADFELIDRDVCRAADEGLFLRKAGVVVAVFDDDGRILVLEHEQSDDYPQGALGASMETFRTVDSRRTTTEAQGLESPVEAWQRSLDEELRIDAPDLAGIYFDASSRIYHNRWVKDARSDGHQEGFSSYSFTVRAREPEELICKDRPSEEVIGSYFKYPDEILNNDSLVLRPGFRNWLDMMMIAQPNGPSVDKDIEWASALPVTGPDLLYDRLAQ